MDENTREDPPKVMPFLDGTEIVPLPSIPPLPPSGDVFLACDNDDKARAENEDMDPFEVEDGDGALVEGSSSVPPVSTAVGSNVNVIDALIEAKRAA